MTTEPMLSIDPAAVHVANTEFLRRKSDDTLDDLDVRSTETKAAIGQLDTQIAMLREEKRQSGTSADQKLIIRTRVSNVTRLRAQLVGDRKKLRTRLSGFARKEILADRLDQLRTDAKDRAKRSIWKKALMRHLRKLPTEIYRKATIAKLADTKEKYIIQADALADIAAEKNADLQHDTAERFLKEYRPEWFAKMSADADYRHELIDILIDAINDNKPFSENASTESVA